MQQVFLAAFAVLAVVGAVAVAVPTAEMPTSMDGKTGILVMRNATVMSTAAEMFVEENNKRTGVKWTIVDACPSSSSSSGSADFLVEARTQLDWTAVEQARTTLLTAGAMGSESSLTRALQVLQNTTTDDTMVMWRKQIFNIARALYDTIKMKLSVSYGANGIGRGASLDTIDATTTDRPWLTHQITSIMAVKSAQVRANLVSAVLNRAEPAPGGFYDNLGSPGHMPHVLRGQGFDNDPSFFNSSYSGFWEPFNVTEAPVMPAAWYKWSQSLFDAPLQMEYHHLNKSAQYQIRIVYSGGDGMSSSLITLTAADPHTAHTQRVHDPMKKPHPPTPVTFPVPPLTYASGSLRLSFAQQKGTGGNGRGCQVSEVWLEPID